MTEFAEREQAAFLRWAQGDRHAAQLMSTLAYISQIADDFVDGDVSKEEASPKMVSLLAHALYQVPLNPFLRRHVQDLAPLMASSAVYWGASNKWNQDKQREARMYGFVYRDCLEQVITGIAGIIGGVDWAGQVALEQYELWHRPKIQTFEQWESEEAARAVGAEG